MAFLTQGKHTLRLMHPGRALVSFHVTALQTHIAMNLLRYVLLLLSVVIGQAVHAEDFSTRGQLSVEVLEFPSLADAVRGGRAVPIKVHLPRKGGLFPVVIVSHGAGGNWDTHFAQAQHLASNGYAVLCLDHIGSNTERLQRGLRIFKNLEEMTRDAAEVLGRPRDVSFAIDQAEEWNRSHERLRGRLDLSNVGVMGHSFGAFTAMVVSGMRPALNWLHPRVAPGYGLGPDLRDRRSKAAVALSPQGAGEPFFLAESFATLAVPLLGISGTEDKQQGGLPPENRYQAFSLWPEAAGNNKFVWLANAHHLDFTDSDGGEHRGIRSRNRDDVQTVVRAATLLFFNRHLKGDAAPEKLLTTSGLAPYLRGSVDRVEVRSK